MAADHIRAQLDQIDRESFSNVPDPFWLIRELVSLIRALNEELEAVRNDRD
jgi:hypothetical protein